MGFKLGKNSDDSQHQEAPGEKKKQNSLLVLLLILVGGFTYVYFFTGLIKPQETQKPAEAPASASNDIVKIPLPPREGEAAKPGGKVPGKTDAPKAVAAAPKVAAAPVAVPAKPTPAVKSAQIPAKQKEEPKKVDVAKPADKKSQPAPVEDIKGEKAAAKKPAVADKKSVPAKNGIKNAGSNTQAKQTTIAKAKGSAPASWSLVIGNYVLEETLSTDMGRVRKAGFESVVKPSTRKKTTMNRLLVSEFNERTAALSTLEKLKRHTSDAFVIEQGGKFVVYAGSYLQSEAANSEKARLKEAGFSVIIKHADIAIPSQTLSVGPFSSKKAADSARGTLKGAGIKASLSQP